MAELTQEDRDNYEKLTTAFLKYNPSVTDNPIKKITESVSAELKHPLNDDTGELRKRIDLVDSYLKIHALLLPGKLEDVQGIKNLNEKLNRSLKVVEGETLDLTDEIESFCSDSLLFEFLPPGKFKKWTEDLLSDRTPNLEEKEINPLIQAWGKAVQKFVEDARKKGDPPGKVVPGKPETFASFFCIHNELETLYSRLADTNTVQRSR